jgi:hypothetical protein
MTASKAGSTTPSISRTVSPALMVKAYLYALADLMKAQYDAIVDAGFVLQLDCPDLALSRHAIFAHVPLEEFRQIIAMHVRRSAMP